MTYLQALILGIIQGITEFLPISSSGHLVIVPYLLGWDLPKAQVFPFDVLVQFSTLFAVLIYYRSDLVQIANAMWKGIRERNPFGSVQARVGWLTGLATIPAGLVGYLLKNTISDAFSKPRLAAILLLVTAVFLYLSEKFSKQTRNLDQLDWQDAGIMGIAQALAIFPGISRSGSTISAGLVGGLNRKTAGQFAFLMAIPIMAAAGVLSLFDLLNSPDLENFFGVLAVGFVTSGVIGFFAIKWLLQFISNHSLTPFAFYCAIMGVGTLTLSYFASPVAVNPAVESNPVEPIFITYQSSASWMLPDMYACANEVVDNQPLSIQKVEASVMPENSDLHISYGELFPAPQEVYQVSKDDIVVAVNENNPIDNLSPSFLQSIFSGEINNLELLYETCSSCFLERPVAEVINIWQYPESSSMQTLIDGTAQLHFSSASSIAPSPIQMAQILKSDPYAIGLLPKKMIDDQLKSVISNDDVGFGLAVPILASSSTEPAPYMKTWLGCLQGTFNK